MKKPKLILHIGHGKTGTTSLQHYLYQNAADILKLGYLYPVKNSSRENHVLLPAGFIIENTSLVARKQVYQDDFRRYKKDFQRFWASLLLDIEKYSPHTVILSAEQMFRDFSGISRIPLADYLGQFFSDVTVVAYMRSPAPDFFSRLAQRAKTGTRVLDVAPRKIRSVIEYYESQFPGCVKLHPFDRQQLLAGDILHDFFSRYVPEALPAIEALKIRPANTSLPWPLLRGLHEIRRRSQPDAERPSLSTSARVFAAAQDYSRLHPKKQKYDVSLQPAVEDFLRRSAVEHLWLKERYGVAFADLDYTRIEALHSPFAEDEPLERIVDFSRCPQSAFPVERYLGNGPRFWMNYLYFFLRLEYARLHRVYIHDSWAWRLTRSMSRKRRAG